MEETRSQQSQTRLSHGISSALERDKRKAGTECEGLGTRRNGISGRAMEVI